MASDGLHYQFEATPEQEQTTVDDRHKVIDALKENLAPTPSTDLAAATGLDTETVHEVLLDLADDQIVEVTHQGTDADPTSSEESDPPPDRLSGRLSAL